MVIKVVKLFKVLKFLNVLRVEVGDVIFEFDVFLVVYCDVYFGFGIKISGVFDDEFRVFLLYIIEGFWGGNGGVEFIDYRGEIVEIFVFYSEV